MRWINRISTAPDSTFWWHFCEIYLPENEWVYRCVSVYGRMMISSLCLFFHLALTLFGIVLCVIRVCPPKNVCLLRMLLFVHCHSLAGILNCTHAHTFIQNRHMNEGGRQRAIYSSMPLIKVHIHSGKPCRTAHMQAIHVLPHYRVRCTHKQTYQSLRGPCCVRHCLRPAYVCIVYAIVVPSRSHNNICYCVWRATLVFDGLDTRPYRLISVFILPSSRHIVSNNSSPPSNIIERPTVCFVLWARRRTCEDCFIIILYDFSIRFFAASKESNRSQIALYMNMSGKYIVA